MDSTFAVIFLLAAIQGLLLTILLMTRRQNHAANLILAVFVGALSLDLLQSVYYMTGSYRSFPHLLGITFVFPFLYGPLFYLYVCRLCQEREGMGWKAWMHLLPVAGVVVVLTPIYVQSGEEKIAYAQRLITGHPEPFSVLNIILPFYGLAYTVLAVVVIVRYRARIRETFSNIERINLAWLRGLTTGVAFTWFVVIVGTFLSYVAPAPWADFTGVAANLCMSVLVYAIGYMGLNQPEIFRPLLAEGAPATGRPVETGVASPYARSGLTAAAADEIVARLRHVMEHQKPYLDENLTLGMLARQLAISPHNLSQAINSRLAMNFYDLVNAYRVEEVKRRLLNGDGRRFSILSIALDAGFASKTSFNTVFRKQSGMTPTQFLAAHHPGPSDDTTRAGERRGDPAP